MTGMMLYFSLGLMILTVLSSRYWRRQLVSVRESQAKTREKMEELTKEVADVAAAYAQLTNQQSEAEKRVAKAEQDLQAALIELDAKKEAPVNRYYVLDRQEPRQGRFWEAAVRYNPANTLATDRQGQRTWTGIRRYVMIAEAERDVRERIAARFPRKAGFELVEVAPCRLNGLAVNRIAEFSTFRKPGAAEEDAKPARRAARAGG
ncbi:hypothetical protein [Azospirillum soli]|uniref:hypothetical protein n=1 Tax=Azospirillum soli TaxID=1304799 RepID=UPI001AE41AAF|nr:hypothetical protein [Azospirillum soli]MBP2311244.1 putative membrane protein YccC [Azospirillum soli]